MWCFWSSSLLGGHLSGTLRAAPLCCLFLSVFSSDELETALSSVSKSVVFLEELADPADGELQEAHCVSYCRDSAPLSSGGGTSVEGCVTGSAC